MCIKLVVIIVGTFLFLGKRRYVKQKPLKRIFFVVAF